MIKHLIRILFIKKTYALGLVLIIVHANTGTSFIHPNIGTMHGELLVSVCQLFIQNAAYILG